MPRLPHIESTNQKVYLDAVAVLLKEKGLPGANPHISRVLRVDLFGKGEDAVLIEASSPDDKLDAGFQGAAPRPNTYSCVMLRMTVGGKLKTAVLVGDFYKRGAEKSPNERFGIGAILDLNGDGVMEIVVDSRYYEGNGTQVFEIKSGAPQPVLEAVDGV